MKNGTLAVVNGAGGFIGSNLVRRLLEAGYQVRATDRPGSDLGWARESGAQIAYAGLDDAKAIDESVDGADLIVHTAAIFDLSADRDHILDTNVTGTDYYCRSALRHGCKRLIMFSTSGVYGVPRDCPISEDGPKRPRNPYEESKWESEKLAMAFHRQQGLPVVAIRPTLVYGPGSRYGQAMYLTLFMMLRYWGLKSLPLPRGGRLTHHVHVDDVCSAVEALIQAPDAVVGKSFNVADDDPMNAQDVVQLFCEHVGIEVSVLPGVLNLALGPGIRFGRRPISRFVENLNKGMQKTWPRLAEQLGLASGFDPRFDPGWLDYLWADHQYDTTALREFGWRPTVPSFRTGMPDTIKWYEDNGWIPSRRQLDQLAASRQQLKESN